MKNNIFSRAAEFWLEKKRWKKIIRGAAIVVVFCTTYALILPAIAMEIEKSSSADQSATTTNETIAIDSSAKQVDSTTSSTTVGSESSSEQIDSTTSSTTVGSESSSEQIDATTSSATVGSESSSEQIDATISSATLGSDVSSEQIEPATTSISIEINGVSITLTGPETSFAVPLSELSMTAEELLTENTGAATAEEQQKKSERASKAQETIDAAIEETDMVSEEKRLFDIRLWHNDVEIEPSGPVLLTFTGIREPGASDVVQVYHIIEETGEAVDMSATLSEEGAVLVNTDHFSVYGVALLSPAILPDDYAAAVTAINQQLGLATFPIGMGETADLSIGQPRFNNIFYYGNVKRDPDAPFSDAKTYSDYLVEMYISQGITAVRQIWSKYLYDLYDPSFDKGIMSNTTDYPGAATYGDGTFNWPKDADAIKSSPFHSPGLATINPLNYNFLENGVDYSNFVSGLKKTATAVAAGDANSQRRYNIDIVADAQAKAKAPVVLVFQIQTSWQMFDLAHANRLITDLPKNGTNVGAASYNTEMANLYDIKQAMLRLVDYMELNYPGNNIAMAVTDVEHAGTFSMFTGTDASGNPSYITNDYQKLRDGINGWDTFGNCEHVHYSSTALENTVKNLASNISSWEDFYGNSLSNQDVQKVGIIIGGPTENSNGSSGYGVELPWKTFQNAQLNSVYGIRNNQGTPLNADRLISWIDNSENNSGTAFKDGIGTSFTDKYVASNEDAMFNSFVDILNRESNNKGIDVLGTTAYVDDVHVEDTVQAEFFLNKDAAITATILNKDGSENTTKVLTLAGATTENLADGTIVTTTIDNLIITEKPDGTTTLAYNFGKVYNTTKAVLHFQVEAREAYIGSNNVYTNIGTPGLVYDHKNLSTGQVDSYDVSTKDTPMVNVPIRFTTVDGNIANILVGESVNLKNLSDAIVQDAQDRVDNYGQTNGTLSYVWVLPDNTTMPIGSIPVNDGSIGTATFPDRSYTFGGTLAGQYSGTLKVTFTPEAVDPISTFSDSLTKTAVNPLTNIGRVWINVADNTSKGDIIVEKKWVGGPSDNTSVSFHLLANGVPVSESGIPKIYSLTAANNWTMRISDLPRVQDVGGIKKVITYTVEEIPIPAGYTVDYSNSYKVETTYAAKATLTFTPGRDVNADKKVTITYTYGTEQKTLVLAADKHDKFNKDTSYSFDVYNLPLNSNKNPYDISIVSVVSTDGKTSFTNSAGAVKYETGTITIPTLIMTNTPGYILPDTGGIGTNWYTIAGVLLILGSGLSYKLKRSKGESG